MIRFTLAILAVLFISGIAEARRIRITRPQQPVARPAPAPFPAALFGQKCSGGVCR